MLYFDGNTNTMARTAKPNTLFDTMTKNPGDHIRYMFDGHGMDGREQQVWTKGIQKEATLRKRFPRVRKRSGLYAKYWDEVHKLWKENTVKQAKMTAKRMVVALPNDITEAEIDKVAKAILKTVPKGNPATLAVHYTSGKGTNEIKNVHLHGVISTRRGGYGKIDKQYGIDQRVLTRAAVDSTLKKCGYTLEMNPKEVQVTARPSYSFVKWMRKQDGWTRERLRDPVFLKRVVLPEAKGKKAQEWLKQEIKKAEYKKSLTGFEDAMAFGRSARQLMKPITDSYKKPLKRKPRLSTVRIPAHIDKVTHVKISKFGTVSAESAGGKIARSKINGKSEAGRKQLAAAAYISLLRKTSRSSGAKQR